MSTKSDLVRFSRAGDQFHYLWAARRCLGLLSGATGLDLVSIEGLSSSEGLDELDESGAEIVDVAEYYEGHDPSTCSKIDYHQLKHSTVNIDKPWTLSGFEKTLAGFYKRYKTIKVQLETRSNFEASFTFTTNRSVQKKVVDFFARAKARATTEDDQKSFTLLKKYLGAEDVSDVADFLQYFRIDDSNAGYWQQRNLLHFELKGYLPGPDREIGDQLWRLVTEKALPHEETRPEITREDVLRVLRTDEDELYPAMNLIESGDQHFPRMQEKEFLKEILAAGSNPVIIHAEGGVGKTALVQRLYYNLPEGAVGLLYDCFGNGKYRSATASRHTHDIGLVQIANELAAKKLCHPIIPMRQASDADYLKAFDFRLKQAIRVLRAEDSSAKLIIFIDAADNAQMAAEETGDITSFAKNLIREEFHDGVTFVFTARTHRVEKLRPPPSCLQLSLDSFSIAETTQHLHRHFPVASITDISEFHRLSSQNPRVQATTLAKELSLSESLALLGPNPTSVEDAISAIFKSSLDKLIDETPQTEANQILSFCEALSALRPFIPIKVLSLVSGMRETAIKSFVNDVGRPLTVIGEAVQFFDEPSETWFRETYRPEAEKLNNFVNLLVPLASKSSYVSSALPQLMLEAGQYDELVDMALTEEALPNSDPAERRNSSLQRLQFALKAALRKQRFEDAAKLALKAAGETAGDDRQQSLIQDNTHLVSKLYEPHRLREIVAQKPFSTGWYGGQHAYVSSLLSGHKETRDEARGYLRLSHRWVGNWGQLSRKERKNQRLEDNDKAEMAFARFNIDGANGLIEELSSWNPRDIAYRVAMVVFQKLIDRGELSKLEELDSVTEPNVGVSIALIHTLYELQLHPSKQHVEAAFNFVVRFPKTIKKLTENPTQNIEVLAAACAIAQSALRCNIGTPDQIAKLLIEFIPAPLDYYSQHSSINNFSAIRSRSICAQLQGNDISVTDFASDKLKEKIKTKDNQHEREAAEFLSDFGRLLPWHKLWAKALVGQVIKSSLADEIKACRADAAPATRFSHGDDRYLTQSISRLWLEIILLVDPSVDHYAEFSKWKNGLRNAMFIPGILRLGGLCAQTKLLSCYTLDLAREAFDLCDEERSDAETKVSGYCDIAKLVYRISPSEAMSYFNLAIERSGRIGEENMDRTAAFLDLAEAAASPNNPKPKLAYRFSRVCEVIYEYMARDKYFQWKATTSALLNLCPSSGVSIVSRWKDRRFGCKGTLLPTVIDHLVERGDLTAKEQLAFFGFSYDWSEGKMIVEACEDGLDALQAELIKPYIFNHNLSFDDWGRVLTVSDTLKWDRDEVNSRLELARPDVSSQPSYLKPLGDETDEADIDKTQWEKVTDAIAWFVVLDGVDTTDELSVHLAFQRLQNSNLRIGLGKFSAILFSMAPVGVEGESLHAVFLLSKNNCYALSELLKSIPDAWLQRQHIKQVLSVIIKDLCKRHCYDISKSRYHQALPYQLVESLTGITEKDVYGHVIDALSNSPIMLGSGRLFTLAGILASLLNDKEAARVLEFGIELLESDIKPEDGDGPWRTELEPPTNPVTSLSGYLWASLGSPVIEERWEAAHVIGLLCVLGVDHLLCELSKIAQGSSPNIYYGNAFTFYQFAAEQWLALSLHRAVVLGVKLPSCMHEFLQKSCSVKSRTVLTRDIAARACLMLYSNGKMNLDAVEVERLTKINFGLTPTKSATTYDRPRIKPEKELEGDEKYVFAHDFDRYWFPDLGRIFGLSADEIERRCLKVVREDWGISTARLWEADERRKNGYYHNSERDLYKSTAPRTEDLSFYLSYQSLLVVAADLIDSLERYQDPEETNEIQTWIKKYMPTGYSGLWLADRRDPRPTGHRIAEEKDKEIPWPYSVVRDDLYSAVKVENDKICVWGYSQLKSGDKTQNTYVSSALVSSETSEALLRALQTTYNSSDYGLPSSECDDENLMHDPYKLIGWVDTHTQSKGIDDYDPWSASISMPGLGPSNWFAERCRLKQSHDNRFWFYDDNRDAPLLVSMVWGEQKEEGDKEEPESGCSLVANLDQLTKWLSIVDMDLIIEVQITRSFAYGSRRRDEDGGFGLLPPYSLILRLDKYGKFTTL